MFTRCSRLLALFFGEGELVSLPRSKYLLDPVKKHLRENLISPFSLYERDDVFIEALFDLSISIVSCVESHKVKKCETKWNMEFNFDEDRYTKFRNVKVLSTIMEIF